MTTYKERKAKLENYILVKDGIPLGTFGNLKKVVEFMKGKEFPSYWTLVRKNENPIITGDYLIYKVKHH
jgi:hypothetical protein